MKKEEKTQLAIQNALFDLLNIYPLESITITSLCKEAHVSRDAFYHSYRSIDDVIIQQYRKAHANHFKDKYSHIEYYYSKEHLIDFIHFFDENSALIMALVKWNLLEYIAKYNTDTVLKYINEFDDSYIREHGYYFMTYFSGQYFYICLTWLLNNKKESIEELIEMMEHFASLQEEYKKKEEI